MSTRTGRRSALIVIDVQVGVVASAWERDRVVANIAFAVQRAREAGTPVVWVQHHDGELVRDSAPWQWVPELAPDATELQVHKGHNSAFEGTALEAELDRLGVGRVLLAGAASNWCIRASAYAALERGYDVTLLGDAHTTEDLVIAPGQTVLARSVIDDLNTAMRWLSYPGRTNTTTTVREAVYADTAVRP